MADSALKALIEDYVKVRIHLVEQDLRKELEKQDD